MGSEEEEERETTYLIVLRPGRLVLDYGADLLSDQQLVGLLLPVVVDFGFDRSLTVLGFGVGLRFLGFGFEEIEVEIDFDFRHLGLS